MFKGGYNIYAAAVSLTVLMLVAALGAWLGSYAGLSGKEGVLIGICLLLIVLYIPDIRKRLRARRHS